MAQTDYVTLDSVKDVLTLTGTSFADASIESSITAASRALDKLCQRRFYADTDDEQVRYYSADRPGELDIGDLTTFTSLATDSDGDGVFEQDWNLNTDFVLEPLDALVDGADPWPYTRIRVHPAGQWVFPTIYPRNVQLTGQFGWPQVPDNVTEAALLLTTQILTVKRSAPLGIMAFEGGAIRIARANQQVMLLIGAYMKHRIAVA